MESNFAVKCTNVRYNPKNSFYRSEFILNDLSMSVPYNVIYGLIGPSGCGKTTLQRCLWGNLCPNSGSIETLGQVPGIKGSSVPGPSIGYMPQDICLDNTLTVQETLTFYGKCFHLDRATLDRQINNLLLLIGSDVDLDQQINQLSLGQQRRVSFACSIIHQPRLLILDEPTVGSDPLLRTCMWDYMKNLKITKSITIIVSTHYIEEVSSADFVGIMNSGQIICQANPKLLIKQFNSINLEDAVFKVWPKSKSKVKHHYKPDQTVLTQNLPSNSHKLPLTNESDNQSTTKPSFKSLFIRSVKTTWKLMLIELSFLLFINVLQNVIICEFFGGIPKDLKIGVTGEVNGSTASQDFLHALDSQIFTLIPIDSYDQGRLLIEHNQLNGLLTFSEDFDSKLNHFVTCAFKSTINCPTDYHQSTNMLITYIDDSTNRFVSDLVKFQLESTLNQLLSNSSQLVGYPSLFKFIEHQSIFELSDPDGNVNFGRHQTIWRLFIHMAFTIPIHFPIPYKMAEVQSGVNERLSSLGYTSSQIEILPIILITIYIVIYNIIMFFVTILISPFSIKGSLLVPVSLLSSQAVVGVLLGFIISYKVHHHIGAELLVVCHNILGLMVIGCIWPYQSIPYFIKPIRFLIPSGLAGDALVDTMVKGIPMSQAKSFLDAHDLLAVHAVFYAIIIIIIIRNQGNKK